MMRTILYLPLAWLAGCGGEPAPRENDMAANVVQPALPDMPADPPMPGPQPDADIAGISAAPHAQPVTPAQTMAEEPGPAVAAAVTRRYFDRIAAGKADAAWELWDEDGRASGMSRRGFADSFKRYATYRATVGTPGPMEAGAGQRHVTIPVEISGTLRDDTPYAMAGTVTLHRTGVIDGATAAKRQWRISSADLIPRQVAVPTPNVTARYACADGAQIDATFDNVASTVTLRSGEQTLGTLRQQPAGSGIHYAGDGLELRDKGDDATITLPNQPPLTCTAAQ
ncbi:MliC family protein [Sphingomonas qomolangmaensis]|uniref:MliC family protein n=1 Tax=Sphingomonas qomolangmaensis TaxID=2918765 RepID=A0ABY5L710_9SPHN|nr:MliC family protein [Sphingomonas qomolangmaensis]UUL81525.1 MliC family protein [Sphingomonas qomolangmaensis]